MFRSLSLRPRILRPLIRRYSVDPLGLKAILQDLQDEEGRSNPIPNLDASNDVKTEDLRDHLLSLYPPSQSNKEPDTEDLTSFLDSLDLNEDSEYYKNDSPVYEPEKSNLKDITSQERELFMDIFASLNTGTGTGGTHRNVALPDYKNIRLTGFEQRVDQMDQIKSSLEPCLLHINSIQTPTQLLKELDTILERSRELLVEQKLGHIKDKDIDRVISEISMKAKEDPQAPVINILTLATIINQFLKTSNNKFKTGQLTLTIFNTLKNDLNLYLVGCNQETYNEMLRTIWIFHGKLSLYQIENLLTEMTNNGFQGDLVTFNILKQIILDYYNLKMSKLKIIGNTLPIWSKDDDERAQRLESRLRAISNKIKRLD